jgi:threonine dehydrogenase-like Zn-dependent dehydrogenase
MKAAQLVAPCTVRLVESDLPTPGPDEALVEVLACGVCGSDLNAWRGVPGLEYPLPPGAPGHEVWGTVAAIGPGAPGEGSAAAADLPPARLGQRVTGLLQGGYAQYALARIDQLVWVPPDLGGEPLLGEPLACAANVVRRAARGPDQPVAVVGFGYLAALTVQLMFPDRAGDWVAVSRRPESRALALELGARAAYDFGRVPDALWDSFPVVVEAAGVQQALDVASWLTAVGGRLVIAGYHADGPRTINLQSWNWKGIDVINAHERRPETYLRGLRDGLAAVERHRLDLSRLISHRWPLEGLDDALRTAEERPAGYVKGLVLPWSR